MNKIRVMIVDDYKFTREWVRMLSNIAKAEMALEVINEARSGQEAINYLDCSEIRPDVILMDIRFGDRVHPNGLDATKIIAHRYPTIKIVMISSYDDSSYVRKAFQCGAQGYFLKSGEEGIADLCQAIAAVWNGKYFVSYRILERLIELVRTSGDGAGQLGLTDQQLEVARLYAKGKNANEIAEELDISMKTAEAHITAVRKKLNASSPQEVKQQLMGVDGAGQLGLTDQQLEVARLYAKGKSTDEIVEKLLTEVRQKLNASSREEVKQRLMENGLL